MKYEWINECINKIKNRTNRPIKNNLIKWNCMNWMKFEINNEWAYK